MGTPYGGEIRVFSGNFTSAGSGSPLPVAAAGCKTGDSGRKLSTYDDCGQQAGDFECAVEPRVNF